MFEQQTTTPPPAAFETTGAVRLHLTVPSGRIEVRASDTQTGQATIEVAPFNERRELDRKTAEQTSVYQSGDDIYVEVPERTVALRTGALRVVASVPAGSELHASTASTDVHTTGRLGDGTLKGASGDVRIETIGAFHVRVASGDVAIGRAAGAVEASSASGDLRIDQADADVTVNCASGDIGLGRVNGELRATTTSGDIRVAELNSSAKCTTTSGDVEFRRVGTGTVETKAISGDVTVGIPNGTAAWLQVRSISGRVNSRLDAADAPAENEKTVQVIANTVSGDITVRRAGG